MGSPESPTHGKWANIFRLRPNGFKGDGLNDVTWGTGFSGAATSYFEVVIDGIGAPDTFKWRQDGGAFTEDVAITGAAQTLAAGQQITFTATTGHTLLDQWIIGNLKDEPTTEASASAQITDATHRILNPNNPPTFTDSGGKKVLTVDNVRGQATFSGNVANVDVDGNNGFIVQAGLERVGYLVGWEFSWNIDMADASRVQQQWKKAIPGQAGGEGSADAIYIGTDSFFDVIKKTADGVQDYFFLQLFNYDPDNDQTGDHWNVWVTFKDLSISAPIGDIIKEKTGFTLQGYPLFVSNV